ncbi:MAG: hypothetical protein NDF56_05410 [archaeon GB-1845-036]|nr:hypothetical protein [Candidatus Verstraetearchaeota archaeon]MCS7374396.1 hypothetical protein [Candidatus Culexmicrobium thermophilum]RLE56472.1 MAG: hypothetical protein DRJ30_01960 [Candidatus Verstraetearchaeota archaeon]HDO21223.1 hypothetical protein [Candidatus Bathyarchaeota archaeon]
MHEDVTQKIKVYFTAEGYKELNLENLHESLKPDLAFKMGEKTIFINIIDLEVVKDRSRFLKKLMGTVAMSDICEEVYVAIPKILATSIDTAAFKEHGIGMLIIDKTVRKVLEAERRKIAAKEDLNRKFETIETRLNHLEKAVANLETELIRLENLKHIQVNPPEDARINLLESEVQDLRRNMERIVEKLAEIERKLLGTKKIKEEVKIGRLPITEGKMKIPSGELPSYLQENPWLEILSSKRGKSDEIK